MSEGKYKPEENPNDKKEPPNEDKGKLTKDAKTTRRRRLELRHHNGRGYPRR